MEDCTNYLYWRFG